MHWRQCEDRGDALCDIDEDGEPITLRLPWEHRHHWVGWGRRPRVKWQDPDGRERFGLESSRGSAGIRAYDDMGVEYLLPHGGYDITPGPPMALRKAQKAIPAGARWITVHPNGPGSKGQAILIEPAGDGTHRVIGGAGGKLNHLRLHNVKSHEEYQKQKAEKAGQKREAEKARKASLTDAEKKAEQIEKQDRKKKRMEAERRVVEHVRTKLGGVSEDLDEEDLKGLPKPVAEKLTERHHRKQLREAMKRREGAVRAASAAEEAKLEDRVAVERTIADSPDLWSDAHDITQRELHLIDEENARRMAARQPRLPKARTDQTERAAAAVAEKVAKLDPVALTAQRDALATPALASEAMQRDAADYRIRAVLLHNAAEGIHDDAAFPVIESVLRKAKLDPDTDRDTIAQVLREEAAIELTKAQISDADAKRFAELEEKGADDQAWKLAAGKKVTRGLTDEVREAAERLGLRDRDKTPIKQAEAAELMQVLAEVDHLRKLTKDFERVVDDAQAPAAWDKSRRAFDLDPSAPPEHIVEQVQERVLRELAQRLTSMASPGRPEHIQAVVDGHANQLASMSLAVSKTSYVDRDVLDAVGLKNAALLTRHAMEADGHDSGKMLKTLEKHHVDQQPTITLNALQAADAFVPHIEETLEHTDDFEQAALHLDAAEDELKNVQRVVGGALGQMEATATLGQAFRQALPDRMEIDAPKAGMHQALMHLQAHGLEPGDYEADTARGKVVIHRHAWDKLIHRDSKEVIAQRKESDDIKRGAKDEDGWLPHGFVSRSQDSFNRTDVHHPRAWEPVDMNHPDQRATLVDHIGARLTNGERPGDIEKDLLSENVAKTAKDPAAHRELVTKLFPKSAPEDVATHAANKEIRGHRQRLQAKYQAAQDRYDRAPPNEKAHHEELMTSALAELGTLPKETAVPERTESDFHDHYKGLAQEYLDRKHPGASELHTRSLREGATDEQLREATFRMVAARPAAKAAFTPLDKLGPAEVTALRNHFYETAGLKSRTYAEHFDSALSEAVEKKKSSGGAPAAPAGGGLFGGGPARQAEDVTDENFGRLHPESAKALAMQYPREGRELHAQAMGDRPKDHTGPSAFDPSTRAALEAHIEANPGKSAADVAKHVSKHRARLSAAAEAGMSPEELHKTNQLAKLGADPDQLDERATRAGVSPAEVRSAMSKQAKIEVAAGDHERRIGVIRPDHVARELGGKIWDSESAAFERHRGRAGTPWQQFVGMHGDLGRAYQSLQDDLRGKAVQDFQKHYEKVTGNPVTTTTRDIRNAALHEQAMASPADRAALAEKRRKEIEQSRTRAEKGSIDTETGQALGGQYLTGSALENYRKQQEEQKAVAARQTGLFGGAPAPGLFGSTKAAPGPLKVLATPQDPRAAGKGERVGLGDRGEAEIESLIGGGLTDAIDPRSPAKARSGYGAGNLFPGANMDGERADQQRVVKMMQSVKRMGGWLGTGSGKTPTSIGTFTQLHGEGAATHGLFLVPTAVQGQFPEEMAAFTEPGKYKFGTGADKDHSERIGMLKDKKTHMRVLTHQSYAQDVLKLAADHHGVAPEVMEGRLRGMGDKERAQALRDVFDAHGIPQHFTYVDEAHTLTTREGQQETLQSLIIGAAAHPINSPHALFGSGTPHKNDASEVYSMARLIDPERYGDRAKFVANHGESMAANPDAIRRELAHRTYTARIDPPTERRAITNPTIGPDGRKIAGGPLELEPEHAKRVKAVEDAYQAAKTAREKGEVDVEAVKTLNPGRFEGVPEHQHEAIARELTPHAGIMRETAMRRAINQAPIEHNTKLKAMRDVIRHDTGAGKQSIVFTDSLEEARLIHATMEKEGIAAALYHGGLTGDARDNFRRDYKSGKIRVGVMTAAGEAGINMQSGEVVHHYDLPMTMKSHAQRVGRAHRQGQTKDVDVHDWHTNTAYDDAGRRRLREKARLADVFETPLGPMDEHGFAADYHATLNEKHAGMDTDQAPAFMAPGKPGVADLRTKTQAVTPSQPAAAPPAE